MLTSRHYHGVTRTGNIRHATTGRECISEFIGNKGKTTKTRDLNRLIFRNIAVCLTGK